MLEFDKIILFARQNKTYFQAFFRENYRPEPLEKHHFNTLMLLSLEKPLELCRFLKTSMIQLEEIINSPVYKHYTVKKKRGGERGIYAPDQRLKQIQKRLNYFLQAWYLCMKPDEVHGFVINPHYLGRYCNIVANAAVHTDKKHVLNIDLKDFFPSISAKHIKNLFTSSCFQYDEQIATALTLLTTYKGILPTGAPTSPVLSNFVCLKLDDDLLTFCRENRLYYSRYADDLTFSSDTIIPMDTILDIILLIKENGFEMNKKKLRVQSSNRKQTVTGLTVNEIVNVDRKLLKKIRAMLHDLTINGLETATKHHFKPIASSDVDRLEGRFMNRLKGYINFVGQVRGKDDSIYRKLKVTVDKY